MRTGSAPKTDVFVRDPAHPPANAVKRPGPRVGSTDKVYDTLVLGAGLAGIAAATKTLNAGLSTLILEAQDRVGGRAFGNEKIFGKNIELGGYWTHGVGRRKDGQDTNPLYSLGKRLGFHFERTLVDPRVGDLFIDGKRATAEQVAEYKKTEEEYIRAMVDYQAKHGDGDAGKFLPKDSKFGPVIANETGPLDLAGQVQGASSSDTADFRTGRDYAVKEGMDKLVKRLALGLPVRTKTAAKKIKWGADGVEVETTDKKRFQAKQLVISVPLSVLKSGKIEFDPPLDKEHLDALDGLEMGLMNKTFLLFDSDVFKQFKKGAWVVVAHTREDGKYDENASVFVNPDGLNMAVVFTGGDFADQLEKKGPDAQLALGKQKVAEIAGEEAVKKHFVKGFSTEWRKWNGGSYSFAKAGREDAHEKLGKSLGPLKFCGEAVEPGTSGWGASFVAAYRSGGRAGDEVVDDAQKSGAAAKAAERHQPSAKRPTKRHRRKLV